MLDALADVEKFLGLFPVGGAGLTYSGKRTTKSDRKKRTRGLAPNWRDTVFEVAKACFPEDAAAVAVLELAGLRRDWQQVFKYSDVRRACFFGFKEPRLTHCADSRSAHW
jgi:hypothetical protein